MASYCWGLWEAPSGKHLRRGCACSSVLRPVMCPSVLFLPVFLFIYLSLLPSHNMLCMRPGMVHARLPCSTHYLTVGMCLRGVICAACSRCPHCDMQISRHSYAACVATRLLSGSPCICCRVLSFFIPHDAGVVFTAFVSVVLIQHTSS